MTDPYIVIGCRRLSEHIIKILIISGLLVSLFIRIFADFDISNYSKIMDYST